MGEVIRKDFYNDPDAPVVTDKKIGYAANVYVRHGHYVLVQQRSDNGQWALPGGMQDPGESITETAVRECFEETGIEVEIKRLIGVYSDPKHIVAYYRDGELLGASQEASMLFYAYPIGSLETRASSESSIVGWCPEELVLDLDMAPSMKRRIEDALSPRWHNVPILFPPVGAS
jgi:8-oxo-dGTP pyrophosphatase MutT (NUDIX family)